MLVLMMRVYYPSQNSRGELGKETAHLIEILFIYMKVHPRLPSQNCLAQTIPVSSCAVIYFGIGTEYSENPTEIHPLL